MLQVPESQIITSESIHCKQRGCSSGEWVSPVLKEEVEKSPVFPQKESPLTRLIVTQSLHIVQLGSEGGLLFGTDVQVVVKVPDDAEKVGVLASNFVLAGGKVSQRKVGVIDLLVDGVEALQHLLVGHISRGLSPHHLISGSAGISDLIHDENLVLLNLGLHFSESINLEREWQINPRQKDVKI